MGAGMRFLVLAVLLVSATAPATARAGELDAKLGLQATTTGWPDDHGGGGALEAGWWFRPWIAATFVGKEQYAQVDDRMMSYFSFNAAARTTVGSRLRITASLGGVHQH